MTGWLNWRELEKHNDWGVRAKDDATAEMWNSAADVWEARSLAGYEVAKKQVDALNISKDDTVLDICCGTGPLTNFLASKAKHVLAFDYGEHMLEYVKKHADEQGYTNVDTLRGNWYTMQPGIDITKTDIVVTRHSPAQGDILKLSSCATKYCYSIADCISPVREQDAPKGFWIKNANEKEKSDPSERPDGRLYGLNIHFNILYDLGVNPTVNYVEHIFEKRAETADEIINEFYPMLPNELRPLIERKIQRLDDGWYYYKFKSKSSILGWDPNEIDYSLL